MTRRNLLAGMSGLELAAAAATAGAQTRRSAPAGSPTIMPLKLSDAEWKQRCGPAAYNVLRREGTERAFTSTLNQETWKGTYRCAGCDLPRFTSDMEFRRGTGWPSFFTTLPGVFGFSTDYRFSCRVPNTTARAAAATTATCSTMARRPPASANATTAWR